MAAYDTLRAAIDNYIKANGNKEITGTVLNDILNAMVSALGADTRFAGVAVPSTNPGNPEGNVVYFASQAGTYSNFGGIVLPLGIHILVWNGTAWTSQTWFSVDNTPTQNSQNLATSGGILQAIVDAVGVERLRAIGVEVTSCSFDSNTKKISFFNSANTTLFKLDATAFVIDGMVSDVKIEDGNLVIQFNTDAGKQDIEIPLTDIFNPANYYTKTAIDALLTAINNKLAEGCLYRGMAEPTTNPPTPTTKVFYIATKAGTYTNFGNIAVTEGITILKYDGSNWSKEQISYSDGVFDISAYNGTSYADLSAALGTNGENIPQNLRKGGMSVKFVLSSDNNYVQYRLMSDTFNTTSANWQGVDDIPTAGSNNLVKSGGVAKVTNVFNELTSESVQNGYIIRNDGVLVPNNYGYNVYNYDVSNTKMLLIQVDIESNVTSDYSIAYLYKDNSKLQNVIQGQSGKTKFKAILIIKGDIKEANELKITAKHEPKICIMGSENILIPSDISQEWLQENGLTQSKIVESSIYDYLIHLNGSTEVAGAWKTYSFQVKKNHQYIVYSKSLSSVNDTFAAIALFKDGNMVEVVRGSSAGKYIYYAIVTVTSDADYLYILNDRGTVWCYEFEVEQFISTETNVDSVATKVILPTTIYTMPYKNNSIQGIFNRVYIEGLAKEYLPSLRINDMPNIIADVETNGVEGTYTKDVKISANGYADLNTSITIKSTNPTKAANKAIRLMCIGDSLTDHSYPTLVETIFKQLSTENSGSINVLMVGTKLDNIRGNIGSFSYQNRACNEGRAGWAISDYLRHICITASRFQSQNEYTIVGKAAWDSLGLATKTRNGISERDTRKDWSGYTEENGEEIRSTCHGYYDADPSQELWTWLVTKRGLTTFVYNGITYTFGETYSSADDNTQKEAIKYLCENWNLNPFFDYVTVNSSNGQYAFNFAAYISKYKTLDSDGITRLVVGSTAGSLVTNASDYDVLVPTHISLIMSQNDWNNVSVGTSVANDIVLCAQLIREYNNNIKIAISNTRYYGAFNPDLYSLHDGVIKHLKRNDSYQITIYERLMELKETNPNITFLPLYALQTVIGDTATNAIDTLDQYSKNRYKGDEIHTRLQGYLDRAYLVSAWILSTFN